MNKSSTIPLCIRAKTWIYVIAVLQCCVLCAYLGIYHSTSSRSSLVDSLSQFSSGDRTRKTADSALRSISSENERKQENSSNEHIYRVNRDITNQNLYDIKFSSHKSGVHKQFASTNVQTDVKIKTPSDYASLELHATTSKVLFSVDNQYDPGVTQHPKLSINNKSNHKNDSVLTPGNQIVESMISNLDELKRVYKTCANDSYEFAGSLNRLIGLNTSHYFNLKNESVRPKFYRFRNATCLEVGTEDFPNSTKCNCLPEWFGDHCSIPYIVYVLGGVSKYVDNFKLRRWPRRIISTIAFNIEFDLLEARLHEHHDLIDVFIILESSFTHFGETKPLRLLNRMLKGYLKEFHSKICYLLLPYFPVSAKENGWIMDKFHRTYIGRESMKHLVGARPDDIYMYTDADEIPSRESLIFLKMHDGIPEPFGLSLRWSVFGFFWKQHDTTRIMVGSTVGMFRYVLQNDAYLLRTNKYQSQESELKKYLLGGERIVFDWYLADNGGFAGWHCSWCLPPAGIQVKLTSAINADFPRWGNYPEKLNLQYIRNLIKTGMWFDDKSSFGALVTNVTDDYFAPQYMAKQSKVYGHLLDVNQAG